MKDKTIKYYEHITLFIRGADVSYKRRREES